MVLQNRLNYGFNGYQVPRAARSARRRGSYRKKIHDSRQCAIDLLATVAGKLLLEGENFLTAGKKSTGKDQCEILQSSVRKEQNKKENSPKINLCDRLKVHHQSCSLKECTHKNVFSGHASVITTFDCSQRFASAGESKSEGGNSARIEVGLSSYGEFGHQKLKDIPNHHLRVGPLITEKSVAGNGAVQCRTADSVVLNRKQSALVSSDNSAKMSSFGDSVPSRSFCDFEEAVNLVSRSRDDDENSSGCTQPSTTRMAYRSPMRIADRRVRKLLASKYWSQPRKLKDVDLSNIGGELNAGYCNSKACYTRQRSQASFPIKKRKLLDYSSISSSDGGTCSEGLPNSSRMGINRDVSGYHAEMFGADGAASLIGAQHTSSSRDSHVKLRIKSFRVPELFIDIPETATIGSLKRSVMKAVNALLRGGLHVGIVLRGKKVSDDNKTLIQTGISQDNRLDSLGFALEPNPLKAPKSLGPGGYFCLTPTASDTSQPLIRYPPSTKIVHQATSDSDPPVTNLGNLIESDHNSALSPVNASMEKSAADSQALVAVPSKNVEALSVVPVHDKSNRVEIVQRRIRRPFSVFEVEALVKAVEKLGTGRWRDVKRGAFDNAEHRTYVDLKDKWKTLVHTARISPQQRRGETVPQELLDRVLAAHAYWSKHQSKHLKQEQQQLSPHPPPETSLLL